MRKKRVDIVNAEGSVLQSILDQKGVTIAGTARLAGVSAEVVRKLRDGKTIRRDKFFAIINSLEIKPKEILPNWQKNEEDRN